MVRGTRRGRPGLKPGEHGAISLKRETPPTGDGSPGPAVWVARVYIGSTSGKTQQLQRRRASRKAAQEALLEAISDMRKKSGLNTDDVTLGEILERFIERKIELGRAPGTIRTYRYSIDSHLANSKDRPAREIAARELASLLRNIQDTRGSGAAANSKKVLAGALSLAVSDGVLDQNPMRDVERLEKPSSERASEAVPAARIPELIEAIKADPEFERLDLTDLFLLLLMSGLRAGEACALRFADVDQESKTLSVNGTAVREKAPRGMVRQELGKTASSTRTIAVPSALIAIVQRREKEMKASPSQFIFSDARGRPLDPSNVQRTLRSRDLGFARLSTHSFRKTLAQNLDRAGLSAAEIGAYLGHSNPGVTLSVYLKQTSSTAARTATALEGVYSNWL